MYMYVKDEGNIFLCYLSMYMSYLTSYVIDNALLSKQHVSRPYMYLII